MKKAQVFTLVAFWGALALGQTAQRAPVIPIQHGGAQPTPTPLPDPSGIYQGPVTFTENGTSFTQTWRADVQAQPCPDCDPGVYYLDATTFYAIQYMGGFQEKGGIRGMAGTTGTLLGLEFFVANCPFIEADGSYVVATYYGGNFGVSPGTKLTIKNGILSGSASGHDCFGRPFTATVSLSKTSNGPPLSCFSGLRARPYTGSFANSCGGSGSGDLEIIFSGCIMSAVSPGVAAFEATITGGNTFTVAILPLDGCAGGTGTGVINPANGIITGTYSGNSSGGGSCCPLGPFTGSFSLSPKQP